MQDGEDAIDAPTLEALYRAMTTAGMKCYREAWVLDDARSSGAAVEEPTTDAPRTQPYEQNRVLHSGEQTESAERAGKKDNRHAKYQRGARAEKAKCGVAQFQIDLPLPLHSGLRGVINRGGKPEGSSTLFAIAIFAERPEIRDLLVALELHPDREALVDALQNVVTNDGLAARTIAVAQKSETCPPPLNEALEIVAAAMAADPRFGELVLSLQEGPSLQAVCRSLHQNPSAAAWLIELLQSGDREFLSRMSRLGSRDRELITSMMQLDLIAREAFRLVAQTPEVLNIIRDTSEDHPPFQTLRKALRTDDATLIGRVILQEHGIVGWILKWLVTCLLRRRAKTAT